MWRTAACVSNLTNVVFMAPKDGSAVRMIKLSRGKGWPAKAMSKDIYITQLEWDTSSGGQLYALLEETGMAPGVAPSWGGYCAVDVQTGTADWLGAFPVHEVLMCVGAVSGFDSATGTFYTAALTLLGNERIDAYTLSGGAFSAAGSWEVAGVGLNASLAGLAINSGHPPVVVVNPIDPTSTPAGAPTGGPVLKTLLPDNKVGTLYNFGEDEILLSAILGGTTGAQGSVAFLLDDSSLPTPPWAGDKAVLGIVPLDPEDGPARHLLDVAPLFDTFGPAMSPDNFAALSYSGSERDSPSSK